MIVRQADVTDEAQMNAFLEEVETAWGGVDVVCANAGTGGPAGRVEDRGHESLTMPRSHMGSRDDRQRRR